MRCELNTVDDVAATSASHSMTSSPNICIQSGDTKEMQLLSILSARTPVITIEWSNLLDKYQLQHRTSSNEFTRIVDLWEWDEKKNNNNNDDKTFVDEQILARTKNIASRLINNVIDIETMFENMREEGGEILELTCNKFRSYATENIIIFPNVEISANEMIVQVEIENFSAFNVTLNGWLMLWNVLLDVHSFKQRRNK